MEKMCNNLAVNGVLNTQNNDTNNGVNYENSHRNLSPVFGTVTTVKNVGCISSPDDDIPSYQIPRGSKRFSDISEEQDSILPISPVRTPPSVNKFENFEEPLIHTIGTIVKKKGDSKGTLNEESLDVQLKSVAKQFSSVFDELGMLDKDISWNSSMETPAPHPLSLKDYNTIERATLLPETDVKSMQPRALFSPHKGNDIDCVPLKYSSESDDDGIDQLNQMKMSNRCKSLEELKDDTLIGTPKYCASPITSTAKDTEIEKEIAMSPSSPIFRIKRSKKMSRAKKMRALLVKSPIFVENSVEADEDKNRIKCDLDFSTALTENENNTHDDNKGHNSFFSEQSNSIQDDSFQDMSFSCIDELCKSSACLSDSNTTSNTTFSSVVSKENVPKCEQTSKDINLPLVKGKINQSKFFYENTKNSDELHPVLSVDGFLKSAKRLEEGSHIPEKKVNKSFTNRKLIVFNKMVKEIPKRELPMPGVKRIRCENSAEKSPGTFRDNKMIKLDNERESEVVVAEEVKETSCDTLQEINSHFDADDSQMCLTAAYAESLLINRPDLNGSNFTNSVNEETHNKQINFNPNILNEMSCDQDSIKPSREKVTKFPMFSTASGNSISVSDDALKKVRNIFKEDYEENGPVQPEITKIDEIKKEETLVNTFQGFKTASGTAVKISEKSLSKVKNLFKELVEEEDCQKIRVVDTTGFSTASGLKIKISEESLNKARKILDTVDVKTGPEEEFKEITDAGQPGFSGTVGFKTASMKKVEISKESLKKVQALWKGEEEIREEYFEDLEVEKGVIPENIISSDRMISEERRETAGPVQKFCGFSTASGKNIAVCNKALSKAKKMLGEIEEWSTDETVENPLKDEIAGSTKGLKLSVLDNAEGKETTVDNKQDDSEELIPAWLHAYNTSPNLTMDRLQLEPVTSHEDCQYSTPREQYIVKSPILGTTDRFYNRRKRRNPGRKLTFEPTPTLEVVKNNYLKPNFNIPQKGLSAKRGASEMNIDFGVPFKRRKLNDVEVGKLSDEVKEKRKKARLEQMRAGKKGKVKPIKGSHLLKKSETQISWSEAVQGALPERYPEEILLKHGVREDVLAIKSSIAADYKFKSTDFFTSADSFSNVNGFPVGDGCFLIFDDENMAGVEELTRAFFASPGVEPNLISIEWVKNHYKWIVWKLSHYERAFPHIFGGRCLTPHNVLVQLKYRYDREIDRSQRSALRKILERDDSSAKKMVLCVSDIKKTSDLDGKIMDSSLNKTLMSYKLGLTDGWYSCYAQTDSAMTRLVEGGKVLIGTKLVIQGAELLNCEKGVSPLEAVENIHLKISTNSTRRAKWDAKLGFQKNGGALLVSLNSILLNGGLVGRIDVVIARIYPLLYMEKKSDGTHVTRNSRMEDKAAAAYQQQQEAAIEKIYQQVKEELRNKEKEKEKHGPKLSMSNISEVTDAEELYKFYEKCSDPTSFQSMLTSKQKEILIDYQRRKNEMSNKELSDVVQERIKAEKMNSRKLSQLLKIKIVDLHKPDYANPALFTVWNSMEDVIRIFSEGKAISIFNISPANSRFLNSLQINSTRQTRYKVLSQCVEYPARKLTHLNELTVDYEPVFNEVDIVGIVVATHETSYGSRLSQTIFLADQDFNFAGIVFWGTCKDFGWENILTVSSIVACSNLQWNKKRNASSIPSIYVNDTSVFTENPKQTYLKEEIKRLRTSLPEDKKTFISKCAEEIVIKLEESKQNSNLSKNSSVPNDSSLNLSANLKPKYINGFKTKPNASSTPFKSMCFGLDTSEQEPSPIQKRIEKLQMYGEPPPLSPLLPLDNLEKFKSKFRVPFKNVSSPDSVSK